MTTGPAGARAFVVGTLVALASSCAHPPPRSASSDETRASSDETRIRALGELYAAGFRSGDAASVLAATTDDFVAISPGKPPLTGAPLRDEIASDLASMRVERLGFDLVEIEVHGDHAWARGSSRATVVVADERLELTGSFLWILRRTTDGWRIARDAATDDGPPRKVGGR
jgi:ketosteroid isomerase-like protein